MTAASSSTTTPSNAPSALLAGSDGGAEHWATVASLIERRRSARVSDRRPHQDRQRSFQPRHRPAAAVGLSKARPQGRGLRTALTLDPQPPVLKPGPAPDARQEASRIK